MQFVNENLTNIYVHVHYSYSNIDRLKMLGCIVHAGGLILAGSVKDNIISVVGNLMSE